MIQPKIYKCLYLITTSSKQHFEIVWASGVLTADYHSKTVEDCIKWRERRAKALRIARITEKKKEEQLKRLKSKFVGFHHSLAVGNCEAGTEQFCKRHGLNKEYGYRLDYILSLENSTYTRRLINA